MAFKLGDVIVDRLQFGYGAKSNGTPLYALTQLTEANIDITANSTDINDKDGNLVYRKYTGKKGEVTATNAFLNLAVIEAISATDAEIATEDKGIVMPRIKQSFFRNFLVKIGQMQVLLSSRILIKFVLLLKQWMKAQDLVKPR